jgi:hypothetical protein
MLFPRVGFPSGAKIPRLNEYKGRQIHLILKYLREQERDDCDRESSGLTG